MHGKSITQPVWTDIVDFACFRVYQPGEANSLSAFPDYLPSSVAVNTKNQPLPISKNRTATADIIFERAQGVTIHWQHPLATVFLLLGLSLLDFAAAAGAKCVISAKSLPAPGAGQLQAGFEV
jgi:hypothetical protein